MPSVEAASVAEFGVRAGLNASGSAERWYCTRSAAARLMAWSGETSKGESEPACDCDREWFAGASRSSGLTNEKDGGGDVRDSALGVDEWDDIGCESGDMKSNEYDELAVARSDPWLWCEDGPGEFAGGVAGCGCETRCGGNGGY